MATLLYSRLIIAQIYNEHKREKKQHEFYEKQVDFLSFEINEAGSSQFMLIYRMNLKPSLYEVINSNGVNQRVVILELFAIT